MNCCYCNAQHTRLFLFVSKNYSLYVCKKCRLVFTYPQPSIQSTVRHNNEIFDSETEKNNRVAVFDSEYARAKGHVEEIKRFKSGGRYLDIGCSYGIAVRAAGNMGFEAFGVEPTKRAAQYARKNLQLNVSHGTVTDAHFPSKYFDVISMYDVLEHIPKFTNELKEVHRILKPDGVLAIQSPNIESFAAKALMMHWNWLLVPQHLWHFSAASLTRVLTDAGFTVVWKTTEDNVYDFASNYKSTIHIPLLGTGILFKVVRQLLYIAAYMTILCGTQLWCSVGKGGLLRVYAVKG